VALGRPHLQDPNWTLRAAATLGYTGISWPNQYRSGGDQLARMLARERGL
jgi:anthraniloyl-CoA monooxygenase